MATKLGRVFDNLFILLYHKIQILICIVAVEFPTNYKCMCYECMQFIVTVEKITCIKERNCLNEFYGAKSDFAFLFQI